MKELEKLEEGQRVSEQEGKLVAKKREVSRRHEKGLRSKMEKTGGGKYSKGKLNPPAGEDRMKSQLWFISQACFFYSLFK